MLGFCVASGPRSSWTGWSYCRRQAGKEQHQHQRAAPPAWIWLEAVDGRSAQPTCTQPCRLALTAVSSFSWDRHRTRALLHSRAVSRDAGQGRGSKGSVGWGAGWPADPQTGVQQACQLCSRPARHAAHTEGRPKMLDTDRPSARTTLTLSVPLISRRRRWGLIWRPCSGSKPGAGSRAKLPGC